MVLSEQVDAALERFDPVTPSVWREQLRRLGHAMRSLAASVECRMSAEAQAGKPEDHCHQEQTGAGGSGAVNEITHALPHWFRR